MKLFINHSCGWARLCISFLFISASVYAYTQDVLIEKKPTLENESSTEENIETSLESEQNSPATTETTEPPLTEESFPILGEGEQDTVAIEPIGFWDTVRVFIVLAVVIVGIYALVWVLKKFQSRSFTRSETIQVLASRQLSGGGNVHLLKLGKSLFFIGASGQNVTLMKEIHEKEEVDEIGLSLSMSENEEENKKNSFYEKIEHLFKKSQNKHSNKNNTVHTTFDVIKSMFGRQIKRGKELDA